MLSLEDNAEDILNKSLRGWAMAPETAADLAGVPVETVQAMRQGDFDADAARKLAPHLKLNAEKWVAIGERSYHPGEISARGLYLFHNPGGMAVNAFLIWHEPSDTAVIFDTGEDATEMLATIDRLGCSVQAICITHTHSDHVVCLPRLQSRFPQVPVYVGEGELFSGAIGVRDGQVLEIGGLKLTCRSTKGHALDGISYVVEGMPEPIVVVGDALFAGSMGGGMVSWPQALETNRLNLFSLSDATVAAPGHGPLTTIGLEKANNPFYPEF
jgi:hydroxyacylglutathione hydrolase